MSSFTRVFVGALLGAMLLVLGLAVWANAQVAVPLNLSVTPPPAVPPPFTVQVNQAVVISGVTYVCTGPLVFTPQPSATGSLPPVKPAADISISGFRDAQRNPIPSINTVVPAGAMVYIDGSGFGPVAGSVLFAAVAPATVSAWADEEIAVIVPSQSSPGVATPPPVTVTVRRPDGVSDVTLAFAVRG